MNEAANDAAQNMKIAIEQDVFSNVAAGSSLTDINATPSNLTTSNILGFILDAGQTLDENNIPEDNRYMIVSPAAASLLKLLS